MTTTSSLRGGMLALAGLALLIVLAGCGGSTVNPSSINPVNPIEDATKPGSIGGTVFTLASGPMKPEGILDQPFDATITLTGTPDAGGAYSDTTTSVIRGGFVFNDVPPGIYTLSGSVQAPYGSPTVLTGEVSGVRVRGNIPTLMTNLLLFNDTRGARVRGTVYKNGLPVGGAVVSVEVRGYTVDYLQGPASEVYCILSSTTSTAPATLGQYEFRLPVDATRYFVAAHSADSYASDIELRKLNREQTLDFGGSVTGGTFTLSIPGFDSGTYTTSALAYNISNANLKTAIDELLTRAGYLGATATIGGGPCPTDAIVTFSNTSMSLMMANSSLTGSAPTLTVRGDPTILLPGEVRENQNIVLSPGATAFFPTLSMDIVCSTLPAPTALASEEAMITRLAVARKFRSPRGLIERLENQARQVRATRTTATGMIENDLYWQTFDDVSTLHGFHVYRGQQSTGDFLYMGSAQDPLQWYFFDNDPALPLDAARFYTVLSYGPGGLVSQPAKPVVLALPLPQITVNGPADGTTLPAAGNAQFSWQAVPNANSYVLTIYPTKPTYNTALYFEQVYAAGQTTASVWLNSGSEFWWSVSAYNNAEPNYATAISYSAYRKITVP